MRRALMVLVALASCRTASPSTSGAPGADAAKPAPPAPSASASTEADAEAELIPTQTLPPSYVHYDINHVLATGQSLAVGFKGMPPLSTSQPYKNLSFASGVIAEEYGLGAFVPLVEGDAVPGTPMHVETMSSGFANLVTRLAKDDLHVDHDMLISIHGVSGMDYAGLRRGTKPYALGMKQVTAARDLARKRDLSYVVRAVTVVHGEADHMGRNPHYDQQLLDWQSDYEADIKAITNQSQPIPMFQTQVASFTLVGPGTTSAIAAAQLAAHVRSQGKVILVGPKYHLPYSDGVHLTNEGYRRLGEEYAKVYRRVILEGATWEPVRPRAITRSDDEIFVTFHVPSPPLVFDTTLVSDPGSYGFSFVDDEKTPPAIAEIDLSAKDTVRIRLTRTPTGANRRLRYAWGAPAGSAAGPRTGPRGNLRDSDATRSPHGYALYDWCVQFDEPVP